MKKITDLKVNRTTTRFVKNAFGERVHTQVPIKLKRKVKTISGGKRFGHYLIDLAIISGILYLIGLTDFYRSGKSLIWINCCDNQGGYYFNYISYLVILAYYAIFEGAWGRTPGKLATNSYVINVYAQKPSFQSILLRSISRWVPFESFSCLGERGWHDKWSETYVVSKTELEFLKKAIDDAGLSDDLDILDA